MNRWIILAAGLAWATQVHGQDISWLVEQAPTVSTVLVKALDKSPAFSARLEVNVSGPADPVPSAATGVLESQSGSLRWEVKLADIKSAQLSQNARAIVRQINGDQFLLLTRSDLHANYLVLPGAQAYLEQALPTLKSVGSKTPLGSEKIDGRPCTKELQKLAQQNGTAVEVVVWRAKELKNVPVQVQVTDLGETIRLTFHDLHFRPLAPDQFRVADGLAKYGSMEDLVQAVVLEKMKKRIGL
jgi:hypothetical protein